MGAVKNAFHDEIGLDEALEGVGCPYKVGDPFARVWLDGFLAGNEDARRSLRSFAPPIPGVEGRTK